MRFLMAFDDVILKKKLTPENVIRGYQAAAMDLDFLSNEKRITDLKKLGVLAQDGKNLKKLDVNFPYVVRLTPLVKPPAAASELLLDQQDAPTGENLNQQILQREISLRPHGNAGVETTF